MSDKAGRTQHPTATNDEAAAAKLWTVYISEAEKYDKSLVESWKSDMEGMLIFAGLFSASLTAFLIESYKTLSPDSGEQTVRLLAQISQQLSSPNGTFFPTTQPASFSPSTTSLVCNALWFVSLGLSLSCALIATLLEQWAREFLHKADMRSAPLIRARIYSYLYYGMKRFNVHAVVDIIPLLLHTSLLLFFAGLVAFLIPVNKTMAVICAAILLLVTAAYTVFTCLPLRYMDCPYRTPLSGGFWWFSRWLLRHLESMWNHTAHSDSSEDETMDEAMARAAREGSIEQTSRDQRALVWTVKSLADNNELEPFVDALGDALHVHPEQKQTYCEHIRSLVNHPDLQLRSRMDTLYDSCTDGTLSSPDRNHRQIACFKAFWAISSLSRPGIDSHFAVDFHDSRAYHEWRFADQNLQVNPYAVSAGAMMKWSTYCVIHQRLLQQAQYLAACGAGPLERPNPDFEPIAALFRHLTVCGFYVNGNPYPIRHAELTRFDIPPILQMIDRFLASAPHTILFEYFRKSAALNSQPYQWEATMMTIAIDRSLPFIAFQQPLEWNLATLLHYQARHLSPITSEFNRNDAAIAELCSFWRPDEAIAIPSCLVDYINHRNSDTALAHFMRRSRVTPYLWFCFTKTLSDGTSSSSVGEFGRPSFSDESLTALWSLAFLDNRLRLRTTSLHMLNILDAISKAEPSPISVSVVALVKHRILRTLYLALKNSDTEAVTMELAESLEDALFPAPAINSMEGIRAPSLMKTRIGEARIRVLADLLEHSISFPLPYRVVDAVGIITQRIPRDSVQKTDQIRLATAIEAIFASGDTPELMHTIILSSLWDSYIEMHSSEIYQWLDDPIARQTLKDTFTKYVRTITPSQAESSAVHRRLCAVIRGLDTRTAPRRAAQQRK